MIFTAPRRKKNKKERRTTKLIRSRSNRGACTLVPLRYSRSIQLGYRPLAGSAARRCRLRRSPFPPIRSAISTTCSLPTVGKRQVGRPSRCRRRAHRQSIPDPRPGSFIDQRPQPAVRPGSKSAAIALVQNRGNNVGGGISLHD
jgi:hypothetical protein